MNLTLDMTAKNNEEAKKRSGAAKVAPAARILVVEDDPSVRKLVTLFLQNSGYMVSTAEGPFEALELWKRADRQFDLVLTDVVMPGAMSGSSLAARLKKDQPGIKVLFTSGYTADLLSAEGILASDVNFLQKPYHPETLLDAVREVLAGGLRSHSESLC